MAARDLFSRLPFQIGLAAATAMVFGLHPPAIRAVYQHGGNASFVLVTTMWVRALALAGYCLYKKLPFFRTREDIRQGLIGGVFQVLATAGIVVGLVYLPGPIVIIVLFSHTLMLLFYLIWRGEIKADRMTIATTVAALAGLSLVIDLWHAKPAGSWIGLGFAFMAALATVSRFYVWGRQTRERHPVVVGSETFLVAAMLSIFAFLIQTPAAPAGSEGYLWLGLASASLALGGFGMFCGIALLGPFRWSLFSKLEPLFTALFSALLLGETLKTSQYGGMALLLGSLAAYQLAESRHRKTIVAEAAFEP